MEVIFNWQEHVDIINAEEFFEKINIVPNMPKLNSILNSVRLGYEERNPSDLGLGYRNLILLLVLLNSLVTQNEHFFSLLVLEEPEAHLSNDNQQILKSYLLSTLKSDENIQIVYSTHETSFINKLGLENVILLDNGKAFGLKDILNDTQRKYLCNNPNMDIFKFFFTKNLILVEGITDELFIKSYLNNASNYLYDIEVVSFHKGYRSILDIWQRLFGDSDRKIAVIRDFDNQPKAKSDHEEFSKKNPRMIVSTTKSYTLESEILDTKNNFKMLNEFFAEKLDWEIFESKDDLEKHWLNSQKSDAMYEMCINISDLINEGFKMPAYIQKVLNELGKGDIRND